jgi:hypothetical protein
MELCRKSNAGNYYIKAASYLPSVACWLLNSIIHIQFNGNFKSKRYINRSDPILQAANGENEKRMREKGKKKDIERL